jgi:serine/threonine-protein kinase HipA
LTPLYDMTITQLIDYEPEIDVTLALNGKKSKLKKYDWIDFGSRMGMVPKVVETKIIKFSKLVPKLCETVQMSFLPQEKIDFVKNFMTTRIGRLDE